MNVTPRSIQVVEDADRFSNRFKQHLADCVILTHDGKILMQERFPPQWRHHLLSHFGGHLEVGETVLEGLLRELQEELGAIISPEEITFIGAVSEEFTNHSECVHVHFWHDKDGRITGCYEAEPRYFDTLQDALSHPQIMDYAVWALQECKGKSLI